MAASGDGDAAQPASNATAGDGGAIESPVQGLPAAADAEPQSGPFGRVPPEMRPALTAPVFQTVSIGDADLPAGPLAVEPSVAIVDDPDTVWLVLDSVNAERQPSLAPAPAEAPPEPPATGQPAEDVQPGAQGATAVVADVASPDQPPVVPVLPTTANPPPSAVPSSSAATEAAAGVPASPG